MKYENKNGWTKDIDKDIVFKFSEGYKDFLNECKTEREAIKTAVRLLEECGFKDKLPPILDFNILARIKRDCDDIYYVEKEVESILTEINQLPKVTDEPIVSDKTQATDEA